MNINLQFNNFKELDYFIKELGYIKLPVVFKDQPGEEPKTVNTITKDPEPVKTKKVKEEPKEEPKGEVKEEPKEEPKGESKELTLIDIRNLTKKAFKVNRPAAEDIIHLYGAKLSDIPKDRYSEFAAKVGELFNEQA